ncbi:MAG TPA: sodium-dependent transporter, partial [Synergistales bacterium]|nr:sodium-dependent transporter [Synergistales bacterium]
MSNGVEREQWGSKLGFILAAAGSAVGLGNIWRFPYVCGMNGGAAFLVLYVAIVFIIGYSVMMAEISVGRKAELNAVGSFRKVAGGPWVLLGWMGVACGFIILSYYCVIGGWTIKYILASFTGLMQAGAEGKAGDLFGGFITNTPQVVIYQALFMLITIWIVAQGVGEG